MTGPSLSLQKRDTKMERLTRGPDDVMPDFSPNGKAFAYVTYEDKSIMLCEVGAKSEVLRHDEMLPAWPTFSPDGEHLAYVTQMRTPRLMTVSLHDGAARGSVQRTLIVRRCGLRRPPFGASKERPIITTGWNVTRRPAAAPAAESKSVARDWRRRLLAQSGARLAVPSPCVDQDGGAFRDPAPESGCGRGVTQHFPAGIQKPRGVVSTWTVPAFLIPACALATPTPAKAAVATNKAVSAILLSIGFPCGFVVCGFKPTRRIWRRISRNRLEQPAHHGGNT